MMHFLRESRSPFGGLVRTTFARGDGASTGALAITPALGGNATNSTGCLVCDGVNDWQEHASVSGLSMTQGGGVDKAFSVCAFIRLNSAAGNQCVASKEDYDGVSGSEWYFSIFAAKLRFATLAQTGLTGKIRSGNTTTLSATTWTHVGVTYDGSKTVGGIKLFVNGVEEASYTTILDTAAGMSATNGRLYFGIDSGNMSPNYEDFNGKIMDLHMVEYALSASEMYGFYIHGKDKTRP